MYKGDIEEAFPEVFVELESSKGAARRHSGHGAESPQESPREEEHSAAAPPQLPGSAH